LPTRRSMATVTKFQRELTSSSLSTSASSNVAEYPTGLIVRNTFLDFKIQRPASLEGFIDERHVQSAPGSRLEDLCGEVQLPIQCQVPPQAEVAQKVEAPQQVPVINSVVHPNTLNLAQLIPTKPQLGSPELPTVGSTNHNVGGCKPCAFIWKEEGCGNGFNCPFCHLCDAGEKKRRAKEKKDKIRSLRAGASGLRQAVAGGINRLIS